MAERARIARLFAPLAPDPGAFALTDDAALLTPPPEHTLVITTDSVIAGIHVLGNATPHQYASKLLRRNLSDLAAMGATPWRYSLNLHTPRGLDDAWFEAFTATLQEEQTRFGLSLIGGDSTSGDGVIHLSLTCIGLLSHPPLRRAGAHAHDDLYVSGTLGDAAFALHHYQHQQPVAPELAARYHLPTPRLALGEKLHGIARAVIDISDGLLADLRQLCAASCLGAQVNRTAIPCGSWLQRAIAEDDAAWRFALSGGDDYELLFAAPAVHREALTRLAETLALPLTRIGSLTTETGISLIDADGTPLPLPASTGWEYR